MTSDIILKATGEMSAAANDPSKGQKLLISKKPLRESQGKFQKLKFHTPIFLAYFFSYESVKKLKFIFFKLWSEEQFPLPPENTKTVDHTRSEPRTSFIPEFEKPVSQGPMKSRIPLPVKKTVVPKFEESVGRERTKFDFQRTSDSCKNKKLII